MGILDIKGTKLLIYITNDMRTSCLRNCINHHMIMNLEHHGMVVISEKKAPCLVPHKMFDVR